jgi:hypothetical protein
MTTFLRRALSTLGAWLGWGHAMPEFHGLTPATVPAQAGDARRAVQDSRTEPEPRKVCLR